MRFTITDFTDKKKLLEWLNYDSNPPTVFVETAGSRLRWGMYGYSSKKEEKPVTDETTLDVWWSNHRANLLTDWEKSPLNTIKPQTHKQFLAECLKSLGIKGGTVAERVKKAIAAQPDLYEAPLDDVAA